MIAERFPGLESLTREEKYQLVDELYLELDADDPLMKEPLKSKVLELMEKRWQHYLAHTETAITLDELTQRIQRLKK